MTTLICLKTKPVLTQHLLGMYALGAQGAAPSAGTTEALQKLTNQVI